VAGAALDVVQQPTGVAIRMSVPVAQCVELLAVADAAVEDGGAQLGEAGKIVDGGLDLGGQFARGSSTRQRDLGSCSPNLERMEGQRRRSCRLPVCALPMTSRPDMIRGMARNWMGVGSV